MQKCLDYMSANNGVIERYQGGYWAKQGLTLISRPWFSTTTVEALHARKLIEYIEWKNGRDGRSFPVKARIVSGVPARRG